MVNAAKRRQQVPATGALIRISVSPGELIDKITILELKSERMTDPVKRVNVSRELAVLRKQARPILRHEAVAELSTRLKQINGRLWDLEDAIRDCERKQDFSIRFIESARAIYRTNDERASIKKDLNLTLGSAIVEEKSYTIY